MTICQQRTIQLIDNALGGLLWFGFAPVSLVREWVRAWVGACVGGRCHFFKLRLSSSVAAARKICRDWLE